MKNIIICCDGTNNQLTTDPTNVLRLYNSLDLSDPTKQIGFYDPGVGTLAQPGLINPIAKKLSLVYGLAFGVGFTRNLEESYRFLMHNYEPDDRIYLFGFSRGAFTVRALAGMVYLFGLLKIENENLLPYLARGYDSEDINWDMVRRTKPFTRPNIPFEFLGLWDTVSSLGFTYTRVALPYTANNPSVKVIRQAVAIDERRAYFRQNLWGYQNKDKEKDKDKVKQNVRQVWFAGVHSDVGGGYAEKENTLSKIPFEWIVEEANKFGLLIDRAKYEEQLNGRNNEFSPDAGGVAHESLEGAWWVLEYVPKNATLNREDIFLPLGKRRDIISTEEHPVVVHQSVVDRRNAWGAAYDPPNFPKHYVVEPWSTKAPAKTSPPPRTELSATLGACGEAVAWVGGFYYLLFAAMHLFGQVGLWLIDQFILDEPKSEWVLGVFAAAYWPPSVYTWIIEPHHLYVVGVFALPLIVLGGGMPLINWLSGMSKIPPKVTGKLPHVRWLGYDRDLLTKLFADLKETRPANAPRDGFAAYRCALQLDLLFPLFYGAALAWSLYEGYRLNNFPSHALTALYPWILGLPLITVLADWMENLLLLRQMSRFDRQEPLSKGAIRIASWATFVKLVGLCLTIFAILLVLLLHLQPA